jgi:RimJ/RimL family protein N-acetyltransferase
VLRGEKVYLRVRGESDVALLHRELFEDVAAHARADGRWWRPTPVADSPYAVRQPSDHAAPFTVVEVDGDAVAGEALLWNLDLHNRYAHVGIALLPSVRGRGYGTQTLGLLSHYAFDVLGLHRLQLETLADNAAMIASAEKAGYRIEGTLRESGWVLGSFVDEVVMGLTVTGWRQERPAPRDSDDGGDRGRPDRVREGASDSRRPDGGAWRHAAVRRQRRDRAGRPGVDRTRTRWPGTARS